MNKTSFQLNLLTAALLAGLAFNANAQTQVGNNALASGTGATAVGDNSEASGTNCTAVGVNALAGVRMGPDSSVDCVAIGAGAQAISDRTTAIGVNATAMAPDSVAIGVNAYSLGGTAVGNNTLVSMNGAALGNNAVGTGSVAVGSNARSNNLYGGGNGRPYLPGVAIGNDSSSSNVSTPYWDPDQTSFAGAVSIGERSNVAGYNSVGVGANSTVTGVRNTSVGADNTITGLDNTGLGANVSVGQPTSSGQTGVGSRVRLNGNDATALGVNAQANDQSTALGARAVANCNGGVALGADSTCSNPYEVSVGNATQKRTIGNVANGYLDTDAATVAQLRPTAEALGGGATIIQGQFYGPQYNFQDGTTHNTVGSALINLDGRVRTIEENPGGGGTGAPGPRGPQGIPGRSAYQVALDNGFTGTQQQWLDSLQGAQGPQGPSGADGTGGGSTVVAGSNTVVTDNADGTQTVGLADNVQLSQQGSVSAGAATMNGSGFSVANGASVTTEGVDAGNQRVTSVSAGRIQQGSTDAVNGDQLWQANQQNDQRWTENNDRWTDNDRRWNKLDKRLDGMGAQTAAMANMAMSSVGLPIGKVSVSAGVGFSGNQSALGVGWRIRTNERTSISASFSVGSGGAKAMGGVGVSVILD